MSAKCSVGTDAFRSRSFPWRCRICSRTSRMERFGSRAEKAGLVLDCFGYQRLRLWAVQFGVRRMAVDLELGVVVDLGFGRIGEMPLRRRSTERRAALG